MNYDDIQQARETAREQMRLADVAARDALLLIVGRLRQALPHPERHGNYTEERKALGELKKELRNYDAVTCRWKDTP